MQGISIRCGRHPKCSVEPRANSPDCRAVDWNCARGDVAFRVSDKLRSGRREFSASNEFRASNGLAHRPSPGEAALPRARPGLLRGCKRLRDIVVHRRAESRGAQRDRGETRRVQRSQLLTSVAERRRPTSSKSVVRHVRTPVTRNTAGPADRALRPCASLQFRRSCSTPDCSRS